MKAEVIAAKLRRMHRELEKCKPDKGTDKEFVTNMSLGFVLTSIRSAVTDMGYKL